MSAHEQFYLTCNGCGVGYTENNDPELCTECGETADEIRGIAEDDGWQCDRLDSAGKGPRDFCPNCLPDDGEHPRVRRGYDT